MKPIINPSQLTEEQKEAIRAKYNEIASFNAQTNDLFEDDAAILRWLFGEELFNQDEAEYTEQCQTCMRRIAGEVLEVCKQPNNPYRHCQWHNHKDQDFCAYIIPWDRYPESHWQTILSAEQFAKAKSLNQNKE